jgi:hypothetical protein
MPSAHALGLGDSRSGLLLRPICDIFELYLHPNRILLSKFCPRPPTRKYPLTGTMSQTVETVEKVPFQKLIFEKWEGNIEKRLVFYVPKNILATFWQFFSLLWEIFMNIFRTRGFSTVSLGC